MRASAAWSWIIGAVALFAGLLRSSPGNGPACDCGGSIIDTQIAQLTELMLVPLTICVLGGLLDMAWTGGPRGAMYGQAFTALELLVGVGCAVWLVKLPLHDRLLLPGVQLRLALISLLLLVLLAGLRIVKWRMLLTGRLFAARRTDLVRSGIVLCAAAYLLCIGLHPLAQLTHDMFNSG